METAARSRRLVVIAPPATYTAQWIETFRAEGWHVDWVSYAFEDPDAVAMIPELKRRVAPLTLLAVLREALRARRLLRRLDPDLVHAHWLVGPAWVAALSGRRPYVATAWGSDALILTPASRLSRLGARAVGRTAYAVTGDSQSILDALIAVGLPASRLRRLVFGADPALFTAGEPDRELLRSLGVAYDDPVFVSSRGTRPVYEPETILRGFAEVLAVRPANLLVRVDDIHNPEAATGSQQESQRSRLERLANELGIRDRVVWYTGVPREDLPRLLNSCTAFISVPSSDGTSVALLEALHAEAPVVVSDLPANREWITNETEGHTVPVGDASALGAALLDILERPEQARRAAARAAQRARLEGNAEVERERLKLLYEEALSAPASAQRRRSARTSSV